MSRLMLPMFFVIIITPIGLKGNYNNINLTYQLLYLHCFVQQKVNIKCI